MATMIETVERPRDPAWSSDRFERFLAIASVILLAATGRTASWAGSGRRACSSRPCSASTIRDSNHGRLSFIHILSVWMLYLVPKVVWSARTHNVRQHRSSVRGTVFGALLIAGYFTFPFDRMLGQWLFG